MSQAPRKTRKLNAKKKVQVRDLRAKKDVKGGDGPTENVSLNYGSIKHQY